MTLYGIPSGRLARLDARVDSLNRRAARLGVAPLDYRRTGARWCDFERGRDQFTGKSIITAHWEVEEVDLDGGAIGLPGWTFLGTIEHLDGGNILRAVPGQTIPEGYRTGAQACDHCGLDRQRIDTFVVRHDDGTLKQLGRQCIADYLGHTDPSRLAAWLETVHDLTSGGGESDEDDGPRGTRERITWRPDEIVAAAVGIIRVKGFVSAKALAEGRARGVATSGLVRDWLDGRGKAYRALVDDGVDVTAADYETADTAIAWAAEQRANDYLTNLSVLARQERVDGRALGLLASLPTAYERALGHIAEQAARNEQRALERAAAKPAPTGRVVVTGTVVSRRVDEPYTRYGSTTVKVLLLAADGWRVWVTAPGLIESVQIGDTVSLTATIEQSKDDPTFAFGKRPTKATIIERASDREPVAK